jgi:hypothetical protein
MAPKNKIFIHVLIRRSREIEVNDSPWFLAAATSEAMMMNTKNEHTYRRNWDIDTMALI